MAINVSLGNSVVTFPNVSMGSGGAPAGDDPVPYVGGGYYWAFALLAVLTWAASIEAAWHGGRG